jgi:hypothetical protein
LTYYSIVDPKTKLSIYYTYKRTGLADTSVLATFGLYNTDKSANTITRTRGASEITNFSNAKSNPAGDNFVYIQTSPGSFAQLTIPGLNNLSNRIVHRAELLMEQAQPVTPMDNFLTAPPLLYLDLKDSVKPIPCDFTVVSGLPDITTFGGLKSVVTVSGNKVARYTFNISRYVQRLITNKRPNLTLKLWAPNYVYIPKPFTDECNVYTPQILFALNNVAQGRVKLIGGNTAPNRIRLRIVYSRL